MVRVINVHHFTNQSVQTVEQPTSCTIAAPNKLLLALTNNLVEVRDLENDSEFLFNFPTVDEVIQIVYCKNGNYVATLETKFNRQNKEINFVRIYINWDTVATLQQSKMTTSGISLGASECGMVQPMRARIAGRVTPTTNQSELSSLEMIEIPVKRNPNLIACCQVSGNLLILSQNFINIYKFQICTHDISKLKFIDFEELTLTIELNFIPLQIDFCENYLAAMNKNSMYLCKLIKNDQNTSKISNDNSNKDNLIYNDSIDDPSDDFQKFFSASDDEPIDYAKLIINDEQNYYQQLTINLPSILKENSLIHKNSPFTFSEREMTAKIHPHSLTDIRNQVINHQIKNLIQLKLLPIVVENVQRHIVEEFNSFVLKPLYIDDKFITKQNTISDKMLIKSNFSHCLNGIICIIATQQDAYLYYFNHSDNLINKDYCVATYPFTAPLQKFVVEDYFLHALTEAGLETYTLRFGHELFRNIEIIDNYNVACPPKTVSICLVGLRPFLSVEEILLNDHNLILLANSDLSPTHSIGSNNSSNPSYWTLYNLELPLPKQVFNDFSIVANNHRFSSTQTYCHLLSEAHVILRKSIILKKWSLTGDNVKLIVPGKNHQQDLIEYYRVSCALLGDHFIMSQNDFQLAIPYYKMARISPMEVINRVKKIQDQSNNQSTKGLINYLKTILLEIKFFNHNDIEKIFTLNDTKQNFSEKIFEIFENNCCNELPNLILKCFILREFSTDKLITVLNNEKHKIIENDEKYLALCLLYIQKSDQKLAKNCLEKCIELKKILLENWELLFENYNEKTKNYYIFSDLTTILINNYPNLLVQLFTSLIFDKKLIQLNKLIKAFLEYLPSSIGTENCNNSGDVLQKTLENYFEKYLNSVAYNNNNNFSDTIISKLANEKGVNEALKLLSRSYLSQLQIYQIKQISDNNVSLEDYLDIDKSDSSDNDRQIKNYNTITFENQRTFITTTDKEKDDIYLFSQFRYHYLDKMPPFQIEITKKLYEVTVTTNKNSTNYYIDSNNDCNLLLKKLQALLCSPLISKQIITEVGNFLNLNDHLRGCLSLKSIILNCTESTLLLLENCPQCLLQFGKDRFIKIDEWKFLIANVQRKILQLSQNEQYNRICFFHKKILKDILTYLAISLSLDELLQVFPQKINGKGKIFSTNSDNNCDDNLEILNEIENYDNYITICKETTQANKIHDLITTTAQQLLQTLNF